MNFLEVFLVDAVAALLIVLIFELIGQGDEEGWLGNLLDWVLGQIKKGRPMPSPQNETQDPQYRIAILYQIIETAKLGLLNHPCWRAEAWILTVPNSRVAADRARVLLLDEHQWWGQKIAIRAIVEDKDGWILANLAEKIGWIGNLFVLQHQDRKGAF